jgi:hypothetical protein
MVIISPNLILATEMTLIASHVRELRLREEQIRVVEILGRAEACQACQEKEEGHRRKHQVLLGRPEEGTGSRLEEGGMEDR